MNRFKELRKEHHLTQAEMIRQYNQRFGRTYSIPALSLFENGKRLPELPALQDFAEFYNVSIDYLLGRTDLRNPLHDRTGNSELAKATKLLEKVAAYMPKPDLSPEQTWLLDAYGQAPEAIKQAVRSILKPYELNEKEKAV